jgi:hypothetical protein
MQRTHLKVLCSTGGRDLRPLKGSFDLVVFSSPISCKMGRSFTSLMSSNPIRGNYGHDGTKGWMYRRDEGVH